VCSLVHFPNAVARGLPGAQPRRLGAVSAAPGRWVPSLSAHLAIFSALQVRNLLAAEAAMHSLLQGQREALRSVMNSRWPRLSGVTRPGLQSAPPSKVFAT